MSVPRNCVVERQVVERQALSLAAALSVSLLFHGLLHASLPKKTQRVVSDQALLDVVSTEIVVVAVEPRVRHMQSTASAAAVPGAALRSPQQEGGAPRAARSRPTPSLPAAPAEIVDLEHVTLSSDAPAHGSSLPAQASEGPAGAPKGLEQGRSHGGAAAALRPGGGQGERFLPFASLARRPTAPDLNAALERNYPARARSQGIEGLAVVSARIAASGKVAAVALRSENVVGQQFGEACRRTLLGSLWSPPLDAAGRAVATDITYRCEFRVRY